MARIRTIGIYGNSWVIKLSPIDVKDYGLKEGDEVNVEDMILMRKKRGDKNANKNTQI